MKEDTSNWPQEALPATRDAVQLSGAADLRKHGLWGRKMSRERVSLIIAILYWPIIYIMLLTGPEATRTSVIVSTAFFCFIGRGLWREANSPFEDRKDD